ncbi:spore-associated protein A [Kitasatospora sp. NPDC059673]|uniref:spore-associated protein A n=1 Tax=Kitasatospora sp. NPDC059673 TaxID=3346901 RepID=UPI0036A70C7C
MSLSRTLKALTLSAAAGAALLMVPANAHAAGYTPQSVCGSSYATLDSFNLPGGTSTVYLTYSSATGNNCVATIKNTYVGTATLTGAFLTIGTSPNWKVDSGNYKYYAATYLYAPGQCVSYGGQDYNSNGWWTKGPSWCH